MFLLTLLNNTVSYVNDMRSEKAEVSKYIQKTCFLKKDIADWISDVYLNLFNKENLDRWNEKILHGFAVFCSRQWEFSWKCEDSWYSDGVYVNCYADATATLKINDEFLVNKELKEILKDNPFLTADIIYSYFQNKLRKELDLDFHDYVTCEDYYPPVSEDYDSNFEYVVKEFCNRYGFELIYYEFDGNTSDYI